MDGLLNVSDDEDSLKSDLDGESGADGKGSLKSNSFDQAGVDGDGAGQEEWTATAPSLQEWRSCRRRTTQATPLPMKLVVARVPKEEENAAPSDAGAEPPANEAVFQVVAPTHTDEDGNALSNFDDESRRQRRGLAQERRQRRERRRQQGLK